MEIVDSLFYSVTNKKLHSIPTVRNVEYVIFAVFYGCNTGTKILRGTVVCAPEKC